MHKSIYCGHLCNNKSPEASQFSGTAQLDWDGDSGCPKRVPNWRRGGRKAGWGRAALPLAMPKDFATGREVKLSYK